jgi:DNA processing protein
MTDSTIDLLTLSLLPGVGPRRVRELASRGGVRDAIADPDGSADLLGEPARHALRSGAARRRAEDEARRAEALAVRMLGFQEPDYPDLLLRCYDPPPVLYVRGRLGGGEGAGSVAVVGSRRASTAGCVLARALARDLAAAGLSVVSGLARGVDTAAHQGALDAGGHTVAVLGSGLDRMYPPENARLADQIAARGGAVVSEFPFGSAPLPDNFPRRNRVIAGWSRCTVVVEAAERSGALVTARCALDEGRDVLAVPGHPSHRGSAGTNQLIRDGAVLVRGAGDVLLELGLPAAAPGGAAAEAEVADRVLGSLRRDVPSSLDEIQVRSGWSTPELLARLAELELEGRVRRLPGATFVRQA